MELSNSRNTTVWEAGSAGGGGGDVAALYESGERGEVTVRLILPVSLSKSTKSRKINSFNVLGKNEINNS